MYHNTAKGLAALGRNGDSMLMHVNPHELAGLQRILGPISNNPDTGLPEAFAWGPIMGIIGGLAGSTVDLGLGAAVSQPIADAMPGFLGETGSKIASVAGPALTSGLVNAGLNYAVGGKNAALGGFAQGAMMGGLGGLEANTLLGTEGSAQPMQQGTTQNLGFKTVNAQPSLPNSPVEKAIPPMSPTTLATTPSSPNFVGPTTTPPPAPTSTATPPPAAPPQGFFDKVGSNLSTLGDKYGNYEGMKSLASNYGSPAFLASMVGQGFTQNAYDAQRAKEAKQRYALQDYTTRQNANNLANSMYGQGNSVYGMAAGGPLTLHSHGGYPVSMTIPGPEVDELKEMGGLPGLSTQLKGHATGGYVNTQPFTGHDFYPQSRISSAQPYAGSAPNSVVDTLSEGASFAEGGSPSSSSFNTTFEAIPTESGHSPIVDVSGRKIAVANISGKTVPFYVSTGGGGKASVPAGKWYPYFGHGPDGWFNKSSEAEIGRYYDSPALKQVAEHLDNTLGDMRHETHFNGQKIPNVSTGSVATQFINQGLNPQPHTFQGSPDDLRGTAQWYKDLESNIKNTVSQVHDSVTRGPTNTPSMLPPAVAPAATQGAKYSVPASLREAVNKYGPTLAKGAGTALNVVGNTAMLLEPDSGREAPDADKPQDYPGEGFNPYYADVPSKAYDKAKWIRTPSGQLMNLTPSFAEGGFLDGPGDGQSDSIPASIDGVEPIKVADGEFVVPKHIVDMIGIDKLDHLLSAVRKSSYGTDQQIPQDAGKLAAERLLARYA